MVQRRSGIGEDAYIHGLAMTVSFFSLYLTFTALEPFESSLRFLLKYMDRSVAQGWCPMHQKDDARSWNLRPTLQLKMNTVSQDFKALQH